MDARSLVVRLESPYVEYVATDVPAGDIVLVGLTWPTDYWAGLAIGWLEQGAPIDEAIAAALDAVAAKKGFAQNVRHRAFALARRWEKRDAA